MKLSKQVFSALTAVTLTACAELDAFRSVLPDAAVASGSFEQKCFDQERINAWTADCLEWRRQRDAADEERRQAEETAQSAARDRLAAQAQQEQLRREQEFMAAVKEDERQGYKAMTFEDFALDGRSMIGLKVAIHGYYTPKGDRLVRDPISAVFWLERNQGSTAVLIPLVTHLAGRDSRALLLRCQDSLIGWCPLVVRGRIQTLTVRNHLGAASQQIGLVVESVR